MFNKNPTLREIDSFVRTEKKERIHKILIRHTVCFMRFVEPLLRKTKNKRNNNNNKETLKRENICPML